MIVIYLVMLLLALFFIFLTLRQLRDRRHDRKIISTVADEGGEVYSRLDYRKIIIENSRWLSFLCRLDNSLSMKVRIFSVFVGVLLACKLLGLLPLEMQSIAMCLLLILVVIIVLPSMLVGSAVKTRIKLMMDALPYFSDLIAVCVQAGMTVESSIKFIAERSDELDRNLASLMGHLVKRAEVSGLADALNEFYRSMEMTEMRMFCSTLQQSVHYGTSLYDNLMELSKDIRTLQLLESEEKIGKLSAKMSVPLIIFIMFPITVLIAAPGILRTIKNAIL